MSDAIRKRLSEKLDAKATSVPCTVLFDFLLPDPAHRGLEFEGHGLPDPVGGRYLVAPNGAVTVVRRSNQSAGGKQRPLVEAVTWSGEAEVHCTEPGSGLLAAYQLVIRDGILVSVERSEQATAPVHEAHAVGRERIADVQSGKPLEPATMLKDPNHGRFSGGEYLAFPVAADEVPLVALAQDQAETEAFWRGPDGRDRQPLVGRGSRSIEALVDMRRRYKAVAGIDPIGAE